MKNILHCDCRLCASVSLWFNSGAAPMRILIVEDEPKIAAFLRKGLVESGFVVDVAAAGDDGLHLAHHRAYDLVILDVMLPGPRRLVGPHGLAQTGKQTPVLFLTAKDAIEDRVKGLELGADDYLVKPFAFAELPGSCPLHPPPRPDAAATPPASRGRPAAGPQEISLAGGQRRVPARIGGPDARGLLGRGELNSPVQQRSAFPLCRHRAVSSAS